MMAWFVCFTRVCFLPSIHCLHCVKSYVNGPPSYFLFRGMRKCIVVVALMCLVCFPHCSLLLKSVDLLQSYSYNRFVSIYHGNGVYTDVMFKTWLFCIPHYHLVIKSYYLFKDTISIFPRFFFFSSASHIISDFTKSCFLISLFMFFFQISTFLVFIFISHFLPLSTFSIKFFVFLYLRSPFLSDPLVL